MVKKDELVAELDERYQPQKEGGKTMGNEEFLPKKDFEHFKELEKAQAEAQHYKEELEKVISGHPQPEETIKRWLECPNCKPKFESLMKPQLDEVYDKGKTDMKANLTVDDIPAPLIGEWIRTMRAREKEGK